MNLLKLIVIEARMVARSRRFVGEAKTSGIERRLLARVSLLKEFAFHMKNISTSSASGGCN